MIEKPSTFSWSRKSEKYRRRNMRKFMDTHGTGMGVEWLATDSRLDDGPCSFFSSFESVLPTDDPVLGEFFTLEKYLTKALEQSNRVGAAIALEIGGSGAEVFKPLRESQVINKSIGISLGPIPYVSNSDKYTVLIGDAFLNKTYSQLQSLVPDGKVDIIFERALHGVDINNMVMPERYGKLFATWYGMLREGGIMFIQVPKLISEDVHKWVDTVKEMYPDTLELQYAEPEKYDDIDNTDPQRICALRLRKLEGAPIQLPSLDY